MYKILEAMITKQQNAQRLGLHTIPSSSDSWASRLSVEDHVVAAPAGAGQENPNRRKYWSDPDTRLLEEWVDEHGEGPWVQCEGFDTYLIDIYVCYFRWIYVWYFRWVCVVCVLIFVLICV